METSTLNITCKDRRTNIWVTGWTNVIYTIICLKSVNVRKVQVAILARFPREMSQTDRILQRYILSRVRVSFRPTRRVYYRCKLEYKHDYPERLLHLKLESLELRRLYNDIKVYTNSQVSMMMYYYLIIMLIITIML